MSFSLFFFVLSTAKGVELQYSQRYFDPELQGEAQWKTIKTTGEDVLDIGRIVKGALDSRRFYFRVKNSSASTVQLSSWALPAGLKWANGVSQGPASVPANSWASFALSFDNSTSGQKFGELKFRASDDSANTHRLTVQFAVKE